MVLLGSVAPAILCRVSLSASHGECALSHHQTRASMPNSRGVAGRPGETLLQVGERQGREHRLVFMICLSYRLETALSWGWATMSFCRSLTFEFACMLSLCELTMLCSTRSLARLIFLPLGSGWPDKAPRHLGARSYELAHSDARAPWLGSR